ncbi:MAG TPA: hypothetical protein V6D05_04450 [Stenomitos sp.]
MPSHPSLRDILGLSARAILAQLVLGAPFGLVDFTTVLAKTGQPALAWAVAIAFGCYRAIGLPLVVGGALIGVSERSGRLWAVLVAGLPTAMVAGSYLPQILSPAKGSFSVGRTFGGILALWLLGTLVGMVGYGLGRIYRQARSRKQVDS